MMAELHGFMKGALVGILTAVAAFSAVARAQRKIATVSNQCPPRNRLVCEAHCGRAGDAGDDRVTALFHAPTDGQLPKEIDLEP